MAEKTIEISIVIVTDTITKLSATDVVLPLPECQGERKRWTYSVLSMSRWFQWSEGGQVLYTLVFIISIVPTFISFFTEISDYHRASCKNSHAVKTNRKVSVTERNSRRAGKTKNARFTAELAITVGADEHKNHSGKLHAGVSHVNPNQIGLVNYIMGGNEAPGRCLSNALLRDCPWSVDGSLRGDPKPQSDSDILC